VRALLNQTPDNRVEDVLCLQARRPPHRQTLAPAPLLLPLGVPLAQSSPRNPSGAPVWLQVRSAPACNELQQVRLKDRSRSS
jgi:hypothetical protein